jgi:ferric-dicitrate binding protein FerR (iron transport regulator)
MQYDAYEAEDFASDPAFVKWVRQPDAEQDAFWKDWLAQHPEKAETLSEARRLVNFLQFTTKAPLPEEQEQVKQFVLKQLSAPSTPIQTAAYPAFHWLRVAASVAFLVLGTAVVWWVYFSSPETAYQTAYSEQREILLPDGTQVTLNANSTLSIGEAWQDEQLREVWLEGEAYFKVVKKPKAADGRFIVHTHELDIEVLGTEFNVQARRGKTEVVLNEGKVQLHQRRESQKMIMEPGEKVSLDAGQRLSKVSVDAERYASWKDNRLFFDNTSLQEIFLRIQDIHGYKIQVSDTTLLQQQFTGSCPVNDISILITAISETFNLRVEQDQQQITFHPKL